VRTLADTVGAYALLVRAAVCGSDAFALRLPARTRRPDDHWVLNGRKLWITNANEANLFIVFATVDPGKGYKGITAFLVERASPGFSVGKKEDKLGIRASSPASSSSRTASCPKENVLGEVGARATRSPSRPSTRAASASARRCSASPRAPSTTPCATCGAQAVRQSIADFQGMQFQYADAARPRSSAARLMVYNAARLKDAGKPFIKRGRDGQAARSRWPSRWPRCRVEFLGGVGFTKDYPVEKFFRDAKIGKIYEGTSNMQRRPSRSP
jgi:alkylation response protein AidB-like acyl-CoA dehydrogenase